MNLMIMQIMNEKKTVIESNRTFVEENKKRLQGRVNGEYKTWQSWKDKRDLEEIVGNRNAFQAGNHMSRILGIEIIFFQVIGW